MICNASRGMRRRVRPQRQLRKQFETAGLSDLGFFRYIQS